MSETDKNNIIIPFFILAFCILFLKFGLLNNEIIYVGRTILEAWRKATC